MDNIVRVMAWLEALADKIYLSTDQNDEATRRAYIEGKAKLTALKNKES